MSVPVKRQHEETAVAKVVETGTGKLQHVGGGSGMVMDSMNVFGGGAESRPAKVARHNDEKLEIFSINSFGKPGRDGGGEVPVGEAGNSGKEGPVQPLKIKVREFGGGDRDPGRMDLERKASGGKEYEEVVKESNKEVLGRVDVKAEEQLQGGVTTGEVVVGPELADINRGEGNSEGLRKKSPHEVESKIVVKDMPPMDVKREEMKEKEKKDEKRIERKEDALLQQQQLLLQPHSDVNSEKENEKDEIERDKGEMEERLREREREAAVVEKEGRERVRERDRDKEKEEEGEGEKRKKRGRDQEKDRDLLNAIDTQGAGGEKDKDGVHGYGVQQRKRMLRPRGQSNPANRDSRSRFRPKDNEG